MDEGEGLPRKEQHVLEAWRQEKPGGPRSLISRGMYLVEVTDCIKQSDKDPTVITRRWKLIPPLLNKCSAQVQIPGQEEFGGGHHPLHFPVGREPVSCIWPEDRSWVLGCLSSPLEPCPAFPVLLPGDCQLWWGREAKGTAGKDSILATHSAAEIRWAYLHWLSVKQGSTFREGEGKELLF